MRSQHVALPADDSIYMSVNGYIGVLAMPDFDSLDSDVVRSCAIEGMQGRALRAAQTCVRNAEKNKKPIGEALSAFFAEYVPTAEREFQTIASKRHEIAREYAADRLRSAGKPSDEATAEAYVGPMLASEKHRPAIDAKLGEWLGSYTAPTKRTAKGETPTVDVGNVDDL